MFAKRSALIGVAVLGSGAQVVGQQLAQDRCERGLSRRWLALCGPVPDSIKQYPEQASTAQGLTPGDCA